MKMPAVRDSATSLMSEHSVRRSNISKDAPRTHNSLLRSLPGISDKSSTLTLEEVTQLDDINSMIPI